MSISTNISLILVSTTKLYQFTAVWSLIQNSVLIIFNNAFCHWRNRNSFFLLYFLDIWLFFVLHFFYFFYDFINYLIIISIQLLVINFLLLLLFSFSLNKKINWYNNFELNLNNTKNLS